MAEEAKREIPRAPAVDEQGITERKVGPLERTLGPENARIVRGLFTNSLSIAGLVLIAFLTNIPEHVSAVSFARKDNMTMSLEIGMSSALQIALFVVPVLVLLSTALTGNALDLVFGPFSMVALVMTAMIANYISADGICHWLEGIQLIAVYLLIAIAFYFI